MVRERSRKIFTYEADLLKVFKKWKRIADQHIARMKQLSCTQDEVNDIWIKMYKEVCRKSFNWHQLWLWIEQNEYFELIKSEKYRIFWKELHKFDIKIYSTASLLLK